MVRVRVENQLSNPWPLSDEARLMTDPTAVDVSVVIPCFNEIGTVVMGNVIQAGAKMNPARQAAVRAGLPVSVPEKSRALQWQMGHVTLLELRNQDVPVYVDLGIADAGIVGVESGEQGGPGR